MSIYTHAEYCPICEAMDDGKIPPIDRALGDDVTIRRHHMKYVKEILGMSEEGRDQLIASLQEHIIRLKAERHMYRVALKEIGCFQEPEEQTPCGKEGYVCLVCRVRVNNLFQEANNQVAENERLRDENVGSMQIIKRLEAEIADLHIVNALASNVIEAARFIEDVLGGENSPMMAASGFAVRLRNYDEWIVARSAKESKP